MEVLWKLEMGIMNCRIMVEIQFHNALYGFCMVRGTSTISFEAKLL